MPEYNVDNTEFDKDNHLRYDDAGNSIDIYNEENIIHYHVNMCTLLLLGEWFDYLRSEGVYDNTRIIIVSDHAWNLGLIDDLKLKYDVEKGRNAFDEYFDCMEFNACFMVKDFGAKGFTTDNTFMTNADVPTLAFKDIVKDPVNPFTGKEITDDYKHNDKVYLIWSRRWETRRNNGNKFLPDHWFSVHDDIFKKENWNYEGWH